MKSERIKKLLICVIVILICIIIGCIIYKYIMRNKVNQFSLVKISTYSHKLISDYDNNYRAFIIDDLYENVEIQINGKDYEGEGIYKVGKYNIKVQSGNVIEEATVNIIKTEEERNIYDLYMNKATLPVLFSTIEMVKNENNPTYIWTQRSDTLDYEAIKEYNPNTYISEIDIGDSMEDNDISEIINEMKNYVENAIEKDKNAYFRLHVNFLDYWIELPIFAELGLREDQYEISYLSDGTISYIRKYKVMEENGYNTYNNIKDEFFDILEKIRTNKNDFNLNEEQIENINNGEYIFASITRNNIEYQLQYPNLILENIKDEKVKKEIQENANMVKIDANKIFNDLSDAQKEYFYKFIKLDKKELDNNYFTQLNKKYLIITGTRSFYGNYSEDQFNNMIQQIYSKYNDEYEILYKPHPSALPSEIQTSFLLSLGIKILPGRLPMEAISFIYSDLSLGGFASSLFLNAQDNSTLFFFAKQKEDLVEPLNTLYDDLFQNAKFIQPEI